MRPSRLGPAFSLDMGAPEVDDLARGLGRGFPGQALAHHQGDGILHRGIGPVGDVFVFAAAMVAVLQHGREVRGHAGHPARADGLHAGLLDGIEHGARAGILGGETAMDGHIVAAEAQRHGIGIAAQDRHILRRQLARRLGQARLVAGERRPVAGIDHLDLGALGDGAQASGDRTLQRFGDGLPAFAGFAVRDGHDRYFFTESKSKGRSRMSSQP